ncbi:MAG: tetratricopeptide repeat protein [Myxococcales bacterium]|nr:tetratricopeptide repeat protein [Myxococcales bacterium]
MKRLAHALVTAAALVACGHSTTEYQRSFAEGRRASSAGRFSEAAEAFARSAKLAEKERDRDHAELLAAVEKARAGDVAAALRELDALGARTPTNGTREEALYKAADLRRKSGSEARGLADLRAFVEAHPRSPLARPALGHVLRAHEGGDESPAGRAKGYALLGELAAKVPPETEVGQKIAYERAARTEPREARVKAYVALADAFPYPRGSYWDDALFTAATLEDEAGHPSEAIVLLRRIVAERETSDVVGSYQRPKLTPAMRLIARIQAEKLHDRDAARKTLHELYASYTTSLERDDALWEIAKLHREDKHEDEACAALETLVGTFPDSRYVPCASAVCPRVARPAKSRAPTTCRGYLLRESATDAAAPKP